MPLTTQDVLDAALTILDEYGLADLTMRRLGDALGVRAGALYHHVPNKQTLLAWVADAIVATVPGPSGAWGDALSAWASSLRSALLAHRDSAELVASARAMGLARLDPAEPAATVLRAAGLPAPEADAAATAVLHFVLGHVSEEQARLDWERFGKAGPSERRATDETFALGVRLLRDGIAAQRAMQRNEPRGA